MNRARAGLLTPDHRLERF